jgi:hypothetical protein
MEQWPMKHGSGCGSMPKLRAHRAQSSSLFGHVLGRRAGDRRRSGYLADPPTTLFLLLLVAGAAQDILVTVGAERGCQ